MGVRASEVEWIHLAEAFRPVGFPRGLAWLEAFWAVSGVASKPSSASAVLAERVNQQRGS
jgi:hypothetical protein